MDAVDLVRHGMRASHAWLENLVSDVTQEQANWQPPGTANSIGATYAHIMIAVDVVLNGALHRRKPLIAGEWAGRAGVGELPPVGLFDEWWPHLRLEWEVFRQYAHDVKRSIEDLLDSLTADELEEPVMVGPDAEAGIPWKKIDVYYLHGGSHVYMHGGEIACLKGLQGAAGYRQFSGQYPYEGR